MPRLITDEEIKEIERMHADVQAGVWDHWMTWAKARDGAHFAYRYNLNCRYNSMLNDERAAEQLRSHGYKVDSPYTK